MNDLIDVSDLEQNKSSDLAEKKNRNSSKYWCRTSSFRCTSR